MFLFVSMFSVSMMCSQTAYAESYAGIGMDVSLPHDVTAIKATIGGLNWIF
jgi:hypothetical protein